MQLLVADGCGRACDLVGKMDYGLFLLVEQLAALVEPKRLDLLCSNANPLRRSGMGFGSILAAIHNRCFEIGKLFMFLLHGAGSGHGGIERQKGLQHLGFVGQHSEKIRHTPEPLLHTFIDGL
jgi:hypothetical protein